MRLVLFLLTLTSVHTASAQEAWLLAMPKKYSTFLLQKAEAGDAKAVAAIVGKLDRLIKSGAIKQIERITMNSKTGGLVNPLKKVQRNGREVQVGSSYSGSLDQRNFRLELASGKETLSFSTAGELGKNWSPTLVYTPSAIDYILLERFEGTDGEFATPKHKVNFTWGLGEAGPPAIAKDQSITWLTSQVLEGEGFKFSRLQLTGAAGAEREVGVEMVLNPKGNGRPVYFTHSFLSPGKSETASVTLSGELSAGDTGSFATHNGLEATGEVGTYAFKEE